MTHDFYVIKRLNRVYEQLNGRSGEIAQISAYNSNDIWIGKTDRFAASVDEASMKPTQFRNN